MFALALAVAATASLISVLSSGTMDDLAQFASMVNTALLVVLYVIQNRRGRKVAGKLDRAAGKLDEVHTDVQHAASAAASAAQTAQTAARIAQEIGGRVRPNGGSTP